MTIFTNADKIQKAIIEKLKEQGCDEKYAKSVGAWLSIAFCKFSLSYDKKRHFNVFDETTNWMFTQEFQQNVKEFYEVQEKK